VVVTGPERRVLFRLLVADGGTGQDVDARQAVLDRGRELRPPLERAGVAAVADRRAEREQRPGALGVAAGRLNQLFGVMAALRDAGVEVPGQMSVVSFDEDGCLAFLEVPVTSVSMPLAELGGAAVDQLIARIERRQAGDVMIREPMRLVACRSVGSRSPGVVVRDS